MAAPTTEERLRDIIAAHFGCYSADPRLIDLTAAKLADFDFDSLDPIEITMEIEEAFEIEITDDELAELDVHPVGALIALIEGKVRERVS